MKVLRVEKGEHETVYTDVKPEGAGVYRRNFTDGEFPTFAWEHLIDRNGGTWLRLFDHEQLEKVYRKYLKEHANDPKTTPTDQ